jgi:hypothetical protein
VSRKTYNIMAFSTGGLFHRESVKVAVLYLEIKDWGLVREEVLSGNLLQTRTVSTSKRFCREIISRLKMLSSSELDFLVHTNPQDQGYFLWLAICRRYKFIADFAVEVIRERFVSLKTELHYEDFDFFFNRKSELHAELDEIRLSTRNKLRQVLFKMLRQADLLTSNNIINPAMLSPSFLETIPPGCFHEVLFFPVFESDLRGSLL